MAGRRCSIAMLSMTSSTVVCHWTPSPGTPMAALGSSRLARLMIAVGVLDERGWSVPSWPGQPVQSCDVVLFVAAGPSPGADDGVEVVVGGDLLGDSAPCGESAARGWGGTE